MTLKARQTRFPWHEQIMRTDEGIKVKQTMDMTSEVLGQTKTKNEVDG